MTTPRPPQTAQAPLRPAPLPFTPKARAGGQRRAVTDNALQQIPRGLLEVAAVVV